LKKEKKKKMNEENRNNIIKEIITTERTYVQNLNDLVINYYKPMLEEEATSLTNIKKIFENLETITNLNTILLKNLEAYYCKKEIFLKNKK
jgi:hypothetical protein